MAFDMMLCCITKHGDNSVPQPYHLATKGFLEVGSYACRFTSLAFFQHMLISNITLLLAGYGVAKDNECKFDVLNPSSGYTTFSTVQPQTWLLDVKNCDCNPHTLVPDCDLTVYGYPSGYPTVTEYASDAIIYLSPHSCDKVCISIQQQHVMEVCCHSVATL